MVLITFILNCCLFHQQLSPRTLVLSDSVKRMAKFSSALTTVPPNSLTWFSLWSSTSSTEECCLVNSDTPALSWPYDVFTSSKSISLDLTLPNTSKTKRITPWGGPCVLIFIRSWWIDWCFIVLVHVTVTPPGTAEFFFFFFSLHGCFRSWMCNFFPVKEMNTAMCVTAVAESSTASLSAVMNKLGRKSFKGLGEDWIFILHLDNRQDFFFL